MLESCVDEGVVGSADEQGDAEYEYCQRQQRAGGEEDGASCDAPFLGMPFDERGGSCAERHAQQQGYGPEPEVVGDCTLCDEVVERIVQTEERERKFRP